MLTLSRKKWKNFHPPFCNLACLSKKMEKICMKVQRSSIPRLIWRFSLKPINQFNLSLKKRSSKCTMKTYTDEKRLVITTFTTQCIVKVVILPKIRTDKLWQLLRMLSAKDPRNTDYYQLGRIPTWVSARLRVKVQIFSKLTQWKTLQMTLIAFKSCWSKWYTSRSLFQSMKKLNSFLC